jgi:hypothetical protein
MLFVGRAVAYYKKGDRNRAIADLAQARKIEQKWW